MKPLSSPVVLLALLLGTALVLGGRATLTGGETAVVIHRVDEAHLTASPSAPLFMLVIGSDARPGIEPGRGDALHLLGLNAAAGRATILNIPRDTYVTIPGRGRAKINDAYALGGPALQAQVVGELVGVAVPFVATTTFDGFAAMVDELGGVEVDVPLAMDDPLSGARFPQGRVHMDGRQALAFSRNRHVPDGDLRRTEHQGLVVLSALAKLRTEPGAGPTLRNLAVLMRHTRVEGLALLDLYRLGRTALNLDPANVRNVTMPASLGYAGGSSVVFPGPGAPALFADLRDNAVLDSM